MAYRMTFRFDQTPTSDAQANTSLPTMPTIHVAHKKKRRRRWQLSRFERLTVIFFVLLVSVLGIALYGHVSDAKKVVVSTPVQQQGRAQWGELAAVNRLLILPSLRVWMAEAGVYSNLRNATRDVQTNLASGVPSFVTAKPPFRVLLAPLSTPSEVSAEEAKWTKSEVPFYLTQWNMNQTVLPVPYCTHAQAGVIEKVLLSEVTQLQVLLGQSSVGAGTFSLQAVPANFGNGNAHVQKVVTGLHQLAQAILQAHALSSENASENELNVTLAKAIVDYQTLSQWT